MGLLDVLLFRKGEMKSSLDRALELVQDQQQHEEDTTSTMHGGEGQKQNPIALDPPPGSQPVINAMRFSSPPSLSSSFQQRQYPPAGRKSQEARMRSTSVLPKASDVAYAATLSPSMFLMQSPLDLRHSSAPAQRRSSSRDKWHMA